MSETSSDTESSCGWTIISNEGSDIETLGPEALVEYGTEVLERHPLVETKLQDAQASTTTAERAEEGVCDSLDDTLEERTIAEAPYESEQAGDNSGCRGKQQVTVLSSSEHSDIVTLGDLKEDEHAEVDEDTAANEEFYMGTSCSSQYAFTAAEAAFPAQQSAAAHSSSSEDEAGRAGGAVVRRRRVRRNTASVVAEPEDASGFCQSDEGEEEEEEEEEEEGVEGGEGRQEEQDEAGAAAAVEAQRWSQGSSSSSILNRCILIALIVAFSMGFGHFYGTVQVQERQKTVEKIRVGELDGVRDLIQRHVREQRFTQQISDLTLDDLDEQKVISLLTDVIEKIKRENQELNTKQAHIQAEKRGLEMLLRRRSEEMSSIEQQQQTLTAENQLLRSSLEREEKSLSTLQEELRSLQLKIREREATGASVDSLLWENQRLKEQLEEEKRAMGSFHSQREDTLRRRLDKERKVTDELRRELHLLRSHIPAPGREAEELQARLTELEKRLSYEQQRSDLWERLYVETKEERAKGDTEPKVKKPKGNMAGKMKETLDAVKNSTKEFVHHQKERIKKAKEAVKENLRKFSDSVKLTFRNFKDSASTFINKARGFYKKPEKNSREPWRHGFQKPHHRHPHKPDEPFSHNTRKCGGKAFEDEGRRSNMKGCSGVFDCAYQESMSLFNQAMEPIRADEFHQLLHSYLQQEVHHFHHWKDLESFVNGFFHNGVFIHDRMLFTDFVSGVEDYLSDMHEYHGLDDDVFRDLDDFVYRHFFGEGYTKSYGPNRPFDKPHTDSKKTKQQQQQQRKQQRARSRAHSERKWSRPGRNADGHMADVKIELGPMPFDPKY